MLNESQGELLGQLADQELVHSFKNERYHGVLYTTQAEMKAASFEYIEVFYNRKRQHSTPGYKSPIQLLNRWIDEQNQGKQAA